ncbi:hypothetical protein BU17DRAFT_91661 [Hysterangium stoloniferum]|nr:hypothetical protein BU17DRAFT_91661 [Hysterangium stoloniferum]
MRYSTTPPLQDAQSPINQGSDLSDLTDLPNEESSASIHMPPAEHHTSDRGIRGLGNSRGRPRGRGKGPTSSGHFERAFERRQSKRTLVVAARSLSPLSSLSPSSSPPAPRDAARKRPRQSTDGSPFKRPKVTPRQAKAMAGALPADGLQIASPSRSPNKMANIYVEEDVVWVRLNSDGALQDPEGGEAQWSYWWPAQVTVDDPIQMSVTLFGNDGHGRDRRVVIVRPSESIMLPFRDQGRMRFTSSKFMGKGSRHELQTARGKKLAAQWTQATDTASLADQIDGLPEAPSLIPLINTSKRWKGEAQAPIDLAQTTPTRVRKSSLAPLDEEIKIGEKDGELVLAADHKGRSAHWPARVVGVAQDKRTGKWLYEICHLDGKRKKLERSRFFTSEEEGFATCEASGSLGTWQIILPESDSEGTDSGDEFRGRHQARSPSPSPSNPDLEDIKNVDDFSDLPLARQMRYVYPFLCRVIRREYEPAFPRHDSFMKGGKARQQLGQSASNRGHFSENEMKKVQLLVRKIMLRDERWAERMSDDDGVFPADGYTQAFGDEADELKEGAAADDADKIPDINATSALTDLKSSHPSVHEPLPSAPLSSSITINTKSFDTDACLPGAEPPQVHEDIKEKALLTQSTALGHSDMEIDVGPSTPRHSESQNANATSNTPLARKRPIGCQAYEDLPRSERGLYCADVLLPEAVIQLHLLRDGQRISTRLLTAAEETKLYQRGLELVSEHKVHWVAEIMQMRKLAESSYKRRTKKKAGDHPAAQEILGTSTRTRTRRISE